MIKVDGNFGEGGGAIVRTALALSTITQKPFEIYDIRKGRPQPGLKSQHLYCVRALKRLSDAIAEGDELGSTSLKYYPKKIIAKNTTGVGDAFGAGFTWAYLIMGFNLEKSLNLGIKNSLSVLTKVGAQEGLLNQAEILQ